jgi:phosphoribosylaminoimidazole carboxylase
VHGVSNTVVGVLGGGQLGKMLCQAACQMGIKTVILDPLEGCPASSVCTEHVVGSFNHGDTVREFAKRYTNLPPILVCGDRSVSGVL